MLSALIFPLDLHGGFPLSPGSPRTIYHCIGECLLPPWLDYKFLRVKSVSFLSSARTSGGCSLSYLTRMPTLVSLGRFLGLRHHLTSLLVSCFLVGALGLH